MGRPIGRKNKNNENLSPEDLEKKKKEYVETYKKKLREEHKNKKAEHQEKIEKLKSKLPFEMTASASSIKIFIKSEEELNLLLTLLK